LEVVVASDVVASAVVDVGDVVVRCFISLRCSERRGERFLASGTSPKPSGADEGEHGDAADDVLVLIYDRELIRRRRSRLRARRIATFLKPAEQIFVVHAVFA
jgi:hypothetical protein